MIPVAIAAAILSESAGLPLPHPPAWLFLGLAAYGLSGLVQTGLRRDMRRSRAAVGH